MTEDEDYTLLERWAGGDQSAASTLVQRHFESVYRFFRFKTAEDAEDLVQETFLACVEGRERFRHDGSFRAFLFGTARHILYAHYRRGQRAEALDVGSTSVADLSPNASTLLVLKDEERLLLEGLRRIPLDYQILLELYEWEGMTGPEACEVLGLTEPAMRSRLLRARRALKQVITEIGTQGELLKSTLSDLDGWARAIRARRS